MELAAVEGEVELAGRVEEHDFVMSVEKHIDILTGVAARRGQLSRVAVTQKIPITVCTKITAITSSCRKHGVTAKDVAVISNTATTAHRVKSRTSFRATRLLTI